MSVTEEEFRDIFNSDYKDYRQFSKVEQQYGSSPDLHAFILLNKLVPIKTNIIVVTEYDKIWLAQDMADLIKAGITKNQALELRRCGVSLDDQAGELFMFV